MVSGILKDGDVDFNKSNTEAKPCNIYFISGGPENKILELEIENCDSTATIQNAIPKKRRVVYTRLFYLEYVFIPGSVRRELWFLPYQSLFQ